MGEAKHRRTQHGWEITPHRWYWPPRLSRWRYVLQCLKRGWSR